MSEFLTREEAERLVNSWKADLLADLAKLPGDVAEECDDAQLSYLLKGMFSAKVDQLAAKVAEWKPSFLRD